MGLWAWPKPWHATQALRHCLEACHQSVKVRHPRPVVRTGWTDLARSPHSLASAPVGVYEAAGAGHSSSSGPSTEPRRTLLTNPCTQGCGCARCLRMPQQRCWQSFPQRAGSGAPCGTAQGQARRRPGCHTPRGLRRTSPHSRRRAASTHRSPTKGKQTAHNPGGVWSPAANSPGLPTRSIKGAKRSG